jgi:hypothetical protein
VAADAERRKADIGAAAIREARDKGETMLARGSEMTLVPSCDGVTFNPERVTVRWLEDLHRAEFRFRAGGELAGSAANILITAYVGPMIAAQMRAPIIFAGEGEQTEPGTVAGTGDGVVCEGEMYRAEQIFISYSHKDAAIAKACRNAYRALGFDVLIDIDTLRVGENWNERLRGLIDNATIFQLFWSNNAAESPFVAQEWAHALSRSQAQGLKGFIRPVFWQDPMIKAPEALEHLHFDYIVLPRLETDER